MKTPELEKKAYARAKEAEEASKKAHSRAEEAEATNKELLELLSGAGIYDMDDFEQLLERHKMARADEERCDLLSACDGVITA